MSKLVNFTTSKLVNFTIMYTIMCIDGVSYVDRISQDRLTGLLAWYKQNGLVPKEKRSGGRAVNTRAYSFDDIRRMVAFVINYAEDQALVLPGRVAGFKKDVVKLLPSSSTKKLVYTAYTAATEALGMNIKL